MRLLCRLVPLVAAATAYTDIRHTRFMIKNIDPIVSPGKYKSHMHSFYGSDVVTKDMPTTAELQKGCPSGENPNDLSIYCEIRSLPYPHVSTAAEVLDSQPSQGRRLSST